MFLQVSLQIRRFDSCLRLNNQILQNFEIYCMNMLLTLSQQVRVKYFANSVTAW